MRFVETKLNGLLLVEPERLEDERGFFARTWDKDKFASRGLQSEPSQCSVSFNRERATLRGMHYQADPHQEAKLIRCTAGAIFDAIVDLRPESATFGEWTAFELTAQNHYMLYVPEGMAHGFQTLADATEVFYQISVPYHSESARGVRWNDPAFGIDWPLIPRMLSEKDKMYPDFSGTRGLS